MMRAVRLKERYQKEIAPQMSSLFKYKNMRQVPQVTKIVINMGLGEAAHDNKIIEEAVRELGLIAGQKPVTTKARKAIANFKIREGSIVGCKVTLRKDMMYEFFDRLIGIVIPRIKDFRGLSKTSFDGRGNYAFGLTEQSVFPEIDADKITMVKGMDIIICTSAKTNEEAKQLLGLFGMPFIK